jgi:hypothetical protein
MQEILSPLDCFFFNKNIMDPNVHIAWYIYIYKVWQQSNATGNTVYELTMLLPPLFIWQLG